MTEQQQVQFVELLKLFIEDCGLDRIEACKQAQGLLEIINQ